MANWLETPAHSRWLEHETDRLLGFGAASRHPDGGFGWLDDNGALDFSHDVELWITCRMTHCFSLATMMGRPSASALADHGVAALAPGGAAPAAAPPVTPTAWMPTGEPTLESIEREYLATLLKKYGGNRRKVAEVMGVSERTAYRMMDRHGYK